MKTIIALFLSVIACRASLVINTSTSATDCTVTPYQSATIPCSANGGYATAFVTGSLNFYNSGSGPIASYESAGIATISPGVSGDMSFSIDLPAQVVSESIVIAGYTGTGFISMA